jgi:anthranilate phosphoribosyltransferase
MDAIMSGAATNAQIAAFLTALRMKGETVEELIGFAQVMRQKVVRIRTRGDEVAALTGTDREMLIDTCGTGGDATGTFNVSTATAFVVAGAGLRVAKHGNRSVSSLCGSADVVEALGVSLELTPQKIARCVDEVGIGFLYAPLLHTAMKHVMPARREMGVRTVFNMLGPLTNPARPTSAMVGCFDLRMAPVMAGVLAGRGDSALVVRGEDGLDEFTTAAPSRVWVARDGSVEELVIDSVELGLPRSQPADLRGDDAAFNADVARRTFAGEKGPVRDAVVLNAAAAFAAHSGLPGDLRESLRAGIARAQETIDSGAVTAQLERWVAAAQAAKSAE